jgi:CHAD domain-containing protein
VGFRLKIEEPPAEGYRRILLEQISSLLRYLSGAELDRTSAVHNARRRCKRIRSVLRLIRAHRKEFAREENGVFREISRWLSPFRDADVRLETFDGLLKELEEEERETYAPFREVLAHKPDAQTPWAFGTSVQRAAEAAGAARDRFKALQLPLDADFGLVQAGLKRSYKRGRQAMKTAFDNGASAPFHDWRKRAKDLDYQLQTLRALWPPVLKGFHKELDQLTELLGQHNDLDVLRETLENADLPEGLRPRDLRAFLEHLAEREAHLREEAHAIGERLYAEKPAAFMKRMKAYWTAWKEEAPVAE